MNLTVADTLKQHSVKKILDRLYELEATVVIQNDMISSFKSTVATQKETISVLEELSEHQKALILRYQSMLFGTKSEKDTKKNIPSTSTDEEVTAITLPSTPNTKSKRGQRVGAPGHGRRKYEELPPREVIHELPESERRCPICGKLYEECGTEDSTELEWIVLIQRIINLRKKYRRTCCCSGSKFITTPLPPKLINKGLLTVDAITNLLVKKFLHGQPTNRQLDELQLHCGVRLAPGTIAEVMTKVGELLRFLFDEILLHLRDAKHWHADETRWMQYGDENKHRWWLWVFASVDAVVFILDPSRSRSVPRRVFGLDDESADAKRARGTISCDRWKSYQGLTGLWTAYCWAHVRRDFKDLIKGYPEILQKWAQIWVIRIGRLYYLNKRRLLYEPGTEAFSQADTKLREHIMLMEQFREEEMQNTSLIKDARKVLKSLARHWDGLTLFLDNPAIPLDNNEAERLLRKAVVGRKNFYGSGSLKSGILAECAYSVLMTAAKNDLNPLTYLRAYLNACAENGGKPPTDISRFLPWKASKEDLATWKLPPTAN